ncbi:MAG TPA: hypothetical protein VNK24_11375, partial [Elusimicrobiota bacterium]|nr:hypothetical protein [Elusimicrobiota bacterium]
QGFLRAALGFHIRGQILKSAPRGLTFKYYTENLLHHDFIYVTFLARGDIPPWPPDAPWTPSAIRLKDE